MITFRTSIPVAALAVLTATLAVLAPATSAAVPTCHGKRATIVGSEGRDRLRGTSRADVIITNGSTYVNAREGNDTICVTVARAKVMAGTGNDWVRTMVADFTFLGPGDDTYFGSGWPNRVTDDLRDAPEGRDIIWTGGGPDLVSVGRGVGGFQDVVNSGKGSDGVGVSTLEAPPTGAGSIDGADGDYDRFTILGMDSVRIDVPAGSVAAAGTRLFALRGFESYQLEDAPGRLEFIGGPAREMLLLKEPNALIDTGAGPDSLSAYPGVVHRIGTALGPDVDLGEGFDLLRLLNIDMVTATFDMPVGSFTIASRTGRMAGANRLHTANWRDLTITGTPGTDYLRAESVCNVVIDAGAGDDSIQISNSWQDAGCANVVHGGLGDDDISGSAIAEELYGDEGFDNVRGGGGHDICEAEVVDCPA